MTCGEKVIHRREFLRLSEAADYLQISVTTLWRLGERDANFPRKIRLSSRICLLRKSDLDRWVESKKWDQ